MTKYQVIHNFADLQDDGYIYNVGDKYPHKGRVNKERVEELMSNENKIGAPVIEEVGDE